MKIGLTDEIIHESRLEYGRLFPFSQRELEAWLTRE